MTHRNIDHLVAVAALSAAIALSLNACGSSRTTSSTQSSETSTDMGTVGAQAAVPDTYPGRDTVPVPSPPDTLPRPR